jgi:hypothetical protein
MSKKMDQTDPPANFQFSIARMLAVTAVVAVVFGVFKFVFTFKESVAVFCTFVIAVAAGGLALIGGKKEVTLVLWYLFATILVVLSVCLAFSLASWTFSKTS